MARYIKPRDANDVIPKHLLEKYGTIRDYKLAKREHIREVAAAMDALNEDSAFLPRNAFNYIHKAIEQIDLAAWEMNLDNWGT